MRVPVHLIGSICRCLCVSLYVSVYVCLCLCASLSRRIVCIQFCQRDQLAKLFVCRYRRRRRTDLLCIPSN